MITTGLLGKVRNELDSLHIDLEFIIEDLEIMDNNPTVYGIGYGSKWKKQIWESFINHWEVNTCIYGCCGKGGDECSYNGKNVE